MDGVELIEYAEDRKHDRKHSATPSFGVGTDGSLTAMLRGFSDTGLSSAQSDLTPPKFPSPSQMTSRAAAIQYRTPTVIRRMKDIDKEKAKKEDPKNLARIRGVPAHLFLQWLDKELDDERAWFRDGEGLIFEVIFPPKLFAHPHKKIVRGHTLNIFIQQRRMHLWTTWQCLRDVHAGSCKPAY